MLELNLIKNEGKLLTINNGETFYQLTKYCKKKKCIKRAYYNKNRLLKTKTETKKKTRTLIKSQK